MDKDQTMTRKFIKTITAIVFIGLFTLPGINEAKTNTKGTFHLVYLVSAEKLEVGAKVFVEPLFFTNGERIVFAYNYCRQYFAKKYNIKKQYVSFPVEEKLDQKLIADSLKPIHHYCEGDNVSFNTTVQHPHVGVMVLCYSALRAIGIKM